MNDYTQDNSIGKNGAEPDDDRRPLKEEDAGSSHEEDLWSAIFCPEKSCEIVESTQIP